MKAGKLFLWLIEHLAAWYFAAFLLHVATTFLGEHIHILYCLKYVAEIYGGLWLIIWTFVGMLKTLRDRFGVLIQFRKPIKNRSLRSPVIISKVVL